MNPASTPIGLRVPHLSPRALGQNASQLLRCGDARPEDFSLNETELAELAGPLCQTGAGALAWWRIRYTKLANTAAGVELHHVYRRQRLSALRHEHDLVKVVSLLRSAGIEPVLVKGWAIARHYEDPALRPYGDIDLCVSPAQFAKAAEVLKRIESLDGPFVDLHSGFAGIGVGKRLSRFSFTKTLCPLCLKGKCARHALRDRDTEDAGEQQAWDEIYSRTRLELLEVRAQGAEVGAASRTKDQSPKTKDQIQDSQFQKFPVRILSDEDHLRILCLHLLRSGARRPTWLIDIAALLCPRSEVQSAKSFDWDVCLGIDPVAINYVGTALALAHELLGVDISRTPFVGMQAPRWIVEAVLEQWGGRSVQNPTSKVQRQDSKNRLWTLDFRHWTNAFRRWDNPIRATAAVKGKFMSRPRLRNRVTELIVRLPEVPDHWRRVRQEFRSRKSEVRAQRVGIQHYRSA